MTEKLKKAAEDYEDRMQESALRDRQGVGEGLKVTVGMFNKMKKKKSDEDKR